MSKSKTFAAPSEMARAKSAARIASTVDIVLEEQEEDATQDFGRLLVNYCAKLGISEKILVQHCQKDDSYLKYLQKTKTVTKTSSPTKINMKPSSTKTSSSTNSTKPSSPQLTDSELNKLSEPSVNVIAIYNTTEELIEISLEKNRYLTVKALQVMLLLAQNYPCLKKISIIQTNINVNIINELNKLISNTSITNVYLNELKLLEGNYAILLGPMTRLKSLTISNCGINDIICQNIAYTLHNTSTAGKILVILDLPFNDISDEGAKCIAEALRSNRCLRSLNLASNRITDDGASAIFNTLKEFPLTAEEVLELRRKQVKPSFADDNLEKSADIPNPKTKKQVKQSIIVCKFDPYAEENFYIGDKIYCTGNHVLCNLNLAFNQLTHMSIKKLSIVLNNQCKLMRSSEVGLLKVCVEGNNISDSCPEMTNIQYFLSNNITRLNFNSKSRRKSSVPTKYQRRITKS